MSTFKPSIWRDTIEGEGENVEEIEVDSDMIAQCTDRAIIATEKDNRDLCCLNSDDITAIEGDIVAIHKKIIKMTVEDDSLTHIDQTPASQNDALKKVSEGGDNGAGKPDFNHLNSPVIDTNESDYDMSPTKRFSYSGLTTAGPLAENDDQDLTQKGSYSNRDNVVHIYNVTDGIDECCNVPQPSATKTLGTTRRALKCLTDKTRSLPSKLLKPKKSTSGIRKSPMRLWRRGFSTPKFFSYINPFKR